MADPTTKSVHRRIFLSVSMVTGLLVSIPVQAQEGGLAGVGVATGMAATLGGAGGVPTAGQLTRNMPTPGGGAGMSGDEGAAGGGAGGTIATGAAAMQSAAGRDPRNWTSMSGAQLLAELLRGGRTSVTASRRSRQSARARARYARNLRRMSPRQRSRLTQSKYRVPPVSWLSYYVPEDRYKLVAGIWRFVTIEDDSRRYPVRYYYSPDSPQMLQLLGTPVRNIRRWNRVIGFHTWQDALLAGYRPDPVSRPAPGMQLAQMATLTRGPRMQRYLEFVYSGEISPVAFDANYQYVQRVAGVVRRYRHTRPHLGTTIEQVLGGLLGDNPLPVAVGAAGPTAQTASGGGAGGAAGSPGAPGGGGPLPSMPSPAGQLDKREEDYSTFSRRAGSLSATNR